MPRSAAAIVLLALAAAPAAAAPPSLQCTRAVHLQCEGGACGETEVTPFVLILDGASGQIETCHGEHCESGVFTAQRELGRDAVDTLLFGQATLEAHPLAASFNGRVYGLTVDTAGKAISLSRIAPGSISVLQASDCVAWGP